LIGCVSVVEATPSANYLNKLLNIKNNLDHAGDTPHFTPHLFCAVVCLDTFELPRGPFRPPFESEPSIINEKTIADFTRMAEQTGIPKREQTTPEG
jgi:hypothetical protein